VAHTGALGAGGDPRADDHCEDRTDAEHDDRVAKRAISESSTRRAGAVLGAVADGTLQVSVGGRYPLEQAAAAYEALEGRASTGKLLLVP